MEFNDNDFSFEEWITFSYENSTGEEYIRFRIRGGCEHELMRDEVIEKFSHFMTSAFGYPVTVAEVK